MPQETRFIATFETGRHYKVHRSYIWVGPITATAAVIVVVLLNSIQGLVQLGLAIRDGNIAVSVPLAIGLGALGLFVLFGLLVGLYALGWRNMSYVFDEREFSYYSGIITKRRVHVPYARIQSVNHHASLIQRIAGVCTVAIDSAGGSSNKAVRVPFLRLETAERLRAELFMRKAAAAEGAQVDYAAHADSDSPEGQRWEAERMRQVRGQAPVAPGAATFVATAVTAGQDRPAPNALDEAAGVLGDWRGVYGGVAHGAFGEEPISYEFGLSNHELLLTTVSHDTPIAVALIVGLAFMVTLAFCLLAQDEVAAFLSTVALPIVVLSTVVTWVFGLVGVAFSYGNFHARRRGSRIEVERGLVSREFSGIDVERVQSIEVRQSFIRRLIGYCELSLGRIDAAGEQNSGNNKSKANTKGLVIHPFVKIDRVDEIVDGLVPELADRPRRGECETLPQPALRRALLRRCLWYNWMLWITVAVAICWGVLRLLTSTGGIVFASAERYAQYNAFLNISLAIVIAIWLVVTVARGASAVLWARQSGYAWNRRYLIVHNDGLSTATSTIPRNKIQAATTRDNPFQRRLALTTLRAVTAVGTHSTTVRLLDVPAEVGTAYLEWLE